MTLCGANCEGCGFKNGCKGCEKTCGRPFGGECVAAEYIKKHGTEDYKKYKTRLLEKINGALSTRDLPEAAGLYELPGFFVNFAYTSPDGGAVKYLDDKRIYLGAQTQAPGRDKCYGIVTDGTFILVCSYGEGGTDPRLICCEKI